MKTWNRGRKKATPEQKKASQEWQNERVKIINLVARRPELQKICVVCRTTSEKYYIIKKILIIYHLFVMNVKKIQVN